MSTLNNSKLVFDLLIASPRPLAEQATDENLERTALKELFPFNIATSAVNGNNETECDIDSLHLTTEYDHLNRE